MRTAHEDGTTPVRDAAIDPRHLLPPLRSFQLLKTIIPEGTSAARAPTAPPGAQRNEPPYQLPDAASAKAVTTRPVTVVNTDHDGQSRTRTIRSESPMMAARQHQRRWQWRRPRATRTTMVASSGHTIERAAEAAGTGGGRGLGCQGVLPAPATCTSAARRRRSTDSIS